MPSPEHDDIKALRSIFDLDSIEYKQFPIARRFASVRLDIGSQSLPANSIKQPSESHVPNVEEVSELGRQDQQKMSISDGLILLGRSTEDQSKPEHELASTGLAASLKHFLEERPATWKASAIPRVLPVFSAAGGVGTTTVLATLARFLSREGETVVLLDKSKSLLPLYFGGHVSHQPKETFQFRPTASQETGEQIHVLTGLTAGAQIDKSAGETNAGNFIRSELMQYSGRASCIFADLSLQTPLIIRQTLLAAGVALVVLTPDLRSIISLGSLLRELDDMQSEDGESISVYCLLNQFDSSVKSHVEVYARLQEQLRGSLLPFIIQRDARLADALMAGQTIGENPPWSTNEEVFRGLAGWAKQLFQQPRTARNVH